LLIVKNKLELKLESLKKTKKKIFVPYVTAGYPNLPTTGKLVLALAKAGADAIELGVPFSDPLADGATISRASEAALAKGTTLKKILALVKSLRKKTDTPLILMTYFNPILRFGVKEFCREATRAGVAGLIIPDLPPEESKTIRIQSEKNGLALIFLAAPTSPLSRIRKVAGAGKGFIYYVSVTGITGARRNLPSDLRVQVQRLRRLTDKPILIGFGISTPALARQAGRMADGVIVGSAIVSLIEKNLRNPVPAISRFAASIRRAL
jgi:tryptophan synthase alpha chain